MAQTRRVGMHNPFAQLPDAPRPPSQASAHPSFEIRHARKRGRDVGLAESGFRPAIIDASSTGCPVVETGSSSLIG